MKNLRTIVVSENFRQHVGNCAALRAGVGDSEAENRADSQCFAARQDVIRQQCHSRVALAPDATVHQTDRQQSSGLYVIVARVQISEQTTQLRFLHSSIIPGAKVVGYSLQILNE